MMQKHKGLFNFILTILAIAFIAFVAIMQNKFMNPEFTASASGQSAPSTIALDKSDSTEKQSDEGVAVGEDENQFEETAEVDEDVTPTYSTQVVTVTSLNVRSGPSTDTDIIGGLL